NTSPFVPASTPVEVPAVMREAVDPSNGSIGAATQERTRTVVARAALAQTARIRTTFDVVDNLGHVHRQTAHGQVAIAGVDDDPPVGIAPAIESHTEPALLSTGASWMWRTARTYVSDGVSAFGDTSNVYDPVTGDLLSATQVVTSASTYDFGG